MKKDKGITFSLVILTMFLFSALAIAESQATRYYPLGAKSVENMVPNGEYEIYVLTQDEWQQAGKITFNKFFRERELDLSSFVSNKREVRIKIIQKGGGAAHIDSVFLGGTPPASVEGIQNGLKKLSQKDFDVADAFGKEILITFPEKSKDSVLRLTARVESTAISKTPFQFPAANLYKEMDTNSAFYKYQMNAENTLSPMFKEYSLTGSGHPSGYTYGWVRNDDKNLYVKIDFTPDNTMDGDKDYAKVYVKTKTGLKEFKVSVPETTWGNPDFTYTDKVSYQHKLYDFTIPMKELGIKDVKEEKELLLAFAAYGTAAPPGVDYSPANNRYLVAYDTGGDIYGKFVSADGANYGTDFVICDATNGQYSTSVAYDSINQRYLVVWSDTRNSGTTGSDIYGQLVNVNGSLNGTNFVITNASYNQYTPKVAYDSVNQRYLVVWTDDRNSGTTGFDIYGQLVNANSSLNGTNFVISNAAGSQSSPDVAYDSVNQRYLVVWTDDHNSGTTGFDIYGQLVNANGSLNGNNFVISDAATDQYTGAGSVAYDSINQRYLVVWTDGRNSPSPDWVVYGQLVNANGSLYGTSSNVNFAISNTSYNASEGSVAYDNARQQYLVVWTDNRNYATLNNDIYGQLVDARGSLYQGDFWVINASNGQFSPVATYNSICKNFLVAYWDNFTGSWIIDQTTVRPCWNIDTLLWRNANGAACLWALDFLDNLQGMKSYGPFTNWVPIDYHQNADGTGKLLWKNTSGEACLWTLDASGTLQGMKSYGPFTNWVPLSYERSADGRGRLLWKNTSGEACIWELDGFDNYVSLKSYGPFPGWQPIDYDRNADGTVKLLWKDTSGAACIWTLDTFDNYISYTTYGPFANWTPVIYDRGADGHGRLLWKDTAGAACIWTLDYFDNYVSFTTYGPYANWTPIDYDRNPDYAGKLLWKNTTGEVSLWTLDYWDTLLTMKSYGPFAGWAPLQYE